MGRQKDIQDFIREEKGRFMQKQTGKTIRDLAAELDISIEENGPIIMTLIETALTTKFITELFDNPAFLDFRVIRHFSNEYSETFGLKLEYEGEPCQHCGAVNESWYSLCIHEGSALFAYSCHTNFGHEPDSPYEGCRIAEIKPLMEEYGLLD